MITSPRNERPSDDHVAANWVITSRETRTADGEDRAAVIHAVRLGPITAAGQVYVSQEFAALCCAEDLAAVSFEFLGRLRTARLFEDAPLYRLDRSTKGA